MMSFASMTILCCGKLECTLSGLICSAPTFMAFVLCLRRNFHAIVAASELASLYALFAASTDLGPQCILVWGELSSISFLRIFGGPVIIGVSHAVPIIDVVPKNILAISPTHEVEEDL